ncbi:MAG: NADPH:quinone reductase [Thermodesulfobacteriota bacterium]
MQAIRVHKFGGPEVMRLEEVPDLKPGPGQVVVRVKAVGVNPVDTYIRAGIYAAPPLPFTPGFDAAGEVEAIGPGVTRAAVGQMVYTAGTLSGAYAQQTLCQEAQAHPLPLDISSAQGASLGIPYGIAYRALFQRARALPGETVLVHGASGGVGTAAVQLARAAGLTVIGTGGTPRGRELVAQQGAHQVLDHHAPAYLEEVLRLTGGRGVEVILEMLANVNLGKDLKVLAPGGRVVVIGSRGPVEIDPRDALSREAAILGALIFGATPQEYAGIHAALTAGLENGTLRPVIGRELTLAEAPQAHQKVLEPGAYGKIILIP